MDWTLADNEALGMGLLRNGLRDTFRIIMNDPKTVKPMSSVAQVRGARGLLGWSQAKLAEAAELSEPTVKRFETGVAKVSEAAIQKMIGALETAGVEFIAENGGGAGVRLKRPAQPAIPVEDLNASNDE